LANPLIKLWSGLPSYRLREKEKEMTEIKKELNLAGNATDHIWLMEDGPETHPIGIRMDCGDSGTVYVSKEQAAELASQLNAFLAK
jgi:hypothetical protein